MPAQRQAAVRPGRAHTDTRTRTHGHAHTDTHPHPAPLSPVRRLSPQRPWSRYLGHVTRRLREKKEKRNDCNSQERITPNSPQTGCCPFGQQLCRRARRPFRRRGAVSRAAAGPRELTGGAAPSLGLRRRGRSSGRRHPPGLLPPPHPPAPRGRPGAGLRDLFGAVTPSSPHAEARKEEKGGGERVCVRVN